MVPLADLLEIAAYVAVTSLGVALTGLAVLLAIRRRSLLLSVLVVALVAVVAVIVGVVVASNAMFLSTHDLRVLLVVIALAGAVGVATALALAGQVVRGSRALADAAAALGDGSYTSPAVPLHAELGDLDRELGRMSQRLQEARQRERDLELGRRDLVAWVSHDLRTPLAGIRAMSEALEDGVVGDAATVHRYHCGIRREADRLSAMVDDLFELSRINASALHLDLQDLALADLVSDAVATATVLARTKGVTVHAYADPALHQVTGSVRELGRVLANLLGNAVRYTPSGGSVWLNAVNNDDGVEVAVQDSCGGIPSADLPRLFDVAFRGSTARTPTQDAGAGLGLAIAQGLVHAHAGTISIANHGPGCCVRVVLPAQAPTQAALR